LDGGGQPGDAGAQPDLDGVLADILGEGRAVPIHKLTEETAQVETVPFRDPSHYGRSRRPGAADHQVEGAQSLLGGVRLGQFHAWVGAVPMPAIAAASQVCGSVAG
jgi:hypothetical protein